MNPFLLLLLVPPSLPYPTPFRTSTRPLFSHEPQSEAYTRQKQTRTILPTPSTPARFTHQDTPRETGWYPSQTFRLPDGHILAYDEYLVEGSNDCVAYLPNLAEGRGNPKAGTVATFCRETQKNFLVADWFGRGESTGKIMEATLTRWVGDTIKFLDEKTVDIKGGIEGRKVVLVASGVGAWVALLVARERKDLVRGIVGLSADPDFTEDLLWNSLPEEEKDAIMRDGFKEITWGGRNEVYPITSTLIEDGRKNLLLRNGPKSLEVTCPVRLIHSMDDEEIPLALPLKIADCLASEDVELVFPRLGGHNLDDLRTGPIRNPWIDPDYGEREAAVSKHSVIQRALFTSIYQCLQATLPYDPKHMIV